MSDLIDRQAVCDVLSTEWIKYVPMELDMSLAFVLGKINELPSVTPTERTGHWKRISIDKYSEHAMYWYRCDRCGKDNLGNTDYCPNCGAKMEGCR